MMRVPTLALALLAATLGATCAQQRTSTFPRVSPSPGDAIPLLHGWSGPNTGANNLSTIQDILGLGAPPNGSAGGDLCGVYPIPALCASGVGAGTYGDSTHVPRITFDAKGRATSVTAVVISGGGGGAPGGNPGQLQWNSAGSFAGLTIGGDATLNTGTGALTVGSLGGKAVTLGGALTTSGGFGLTLTLTGTTSVTMPTSGTVLSTASTIGAGQISGLAPSATIDATNAGNLSSGKLLAARLPNPSVTTLGGVESVTQQAHQWISYIDLFGVPHQTQPAATDITGLAAIATSGSASDLGSGTLPALRLPASGVTAATYGDSTHVLQATIDATGRITGASSVVIAAGGSGTVTSVGLTLPGDYTVAGSPVTGAGTLAVTATNQSANTIKAGPASGIAAAPGYRALVTADFPASGVTAATYGDSTHSAQVAIDATGRVTSASSIAIAAGGSGTVTSVGLTMPGIFSVGGTPVTGAGTLGVTLGTEAANTIFAGPVSGIAAVPGFRALVGADLPAPGASTLGGIESLASTSHQWINAISTAGVPSSSQPAATDITGLAAVATSGSASDLGSGTLPAGRLPNPSASTLGGVQSATGASHQWISSISLLGVPGLSQPGFGDLSGTIATGQFPASGVTAATYGDSTHVAQVTVDATGRVTAASSVSVAGGTTLPGFLTGYIEAIDVTNPNTTLAVGKGTTADSTAAGYITTAASVFGSVSGAWASGAGTTGSPVNKMGNGLTVAASTWYHVCAATISGSADLFFDTSATCANQPASTTAVRRVGSFKTDGSSHILAFSQLGRRFIWAVPVIDVNGVTCVASKQTYAASAPLGVVTTPMERLSTQSANGTVWLYSTYQTDATVSSASTFATSPGYTIDSTVAPSGEAYLPTNSSSQLDWRCAGTTGNVNIYTDGYVDDAGVSG